MNEKPLERESFITVKEVKAGVELPAPIYKTKPYVVLSAENVVLDAGDLDHIKSIYSYYDDCEADIRRHDMYLNDNTRIS